MVKIALIGDFNVDMPAHRACTVPCTGVATLENSGVRCRLCPAWR